MKVLLSIIVVFLVAIFSTQNLMAAANHGLVQSNSVQQEAVLFSPAAKVDIHCSEHDGNQIECDMQCISVLSVIPQAVDKLVSHSKAASFLLTYDSAFVNDNLSTLFRPPKG